MLTFVFADDRAYIHSMASSGLSVVDLKLIQQQVAKLFTLIMVEADKVSW